MYLIVHHPRFPASQIADSITYYHSYSPLHSIERLLPEGQVDFVVDLTCGPKHIFDNDTLQVRQSCTRGWISGARTGLISIDAGGQNDSMMIVRMRLGAALKVLGLPLSELTDRVIDADIIFGSSFHDLRDSLLEAATTEEKIRRMELFLLSRCGNDLELPPVLQFAFERLINEPHQQAIEQLVAKAGYSHKHLISLFKKYAGITPKELMKVMRFQRVVYEIEKTSAINWAQLAFDCGYYDQAHFIKEFRSFSGYNPARYLTEKGEMPNYIPVGRQ